ncbi:hypothetical protein Droror1_Dr00003557 [Drosera rotundifolia]
MRVGAMAKAEGRAHESNLGEDVKRRKFIVRADAEMQKRVAAMNAMLDNVGGMYFWSRLLSEHGRIKTVEQLSNATANSRIDQAPLGLMLFCGPSGTRKTMAAKEFARKFSCCKEGLNYALMTGGDVPLGSQAGTKIQKLFDWASKSKKGEMKQT